MASWKRRFGVPQREGRSSFMRASFLYVVGNVLQRGLGLMLLPLSTRILGLEEYGLAGTAVALTTLLAILYGLGLSFSIVRFYYDDPPDLARSGWAGLLRIQAGAALALAVLTFLTGPLWSQILGDIGWNAALQISVFAAWTGAVQSTMASVLRAQQRPGAFFTLVAIQVVIGSGLSLALATEWGAAGYVAGLAAGNVVAFVVAARLTYRRPAWRRGLLGDGLRVSLPSLAHQMSVWGTNLSDRLIIAAYLGAEEVARYTIPYTLGTVLLLLMTSLQQAWAPTYMSQGAAARRALPGQLTGPATIVLVFAVVLLVIVGPLVIYVLAPSGFGISTTLIAIVAIAALPRVTYLIAVISLVDAKKTGRMATASGLGAVFNVVANLIAVPVFGITAAAITTVAANAIMSIMIVLAAQRVLGTSLRLWRSLALWMAGGAAAIGISFMPENWGWAPVRLALALAAGAGLLFALRAVRAAFHAATSGVPLRAEEAAT